MKIQKLSFPQFPQKASVSSKSISSDTLPMSRSSIFYNLPVASRSAPVIMDVKPSKRIPSDGQEKSRLIRSKSDSDLKNKTFYIWRMKPQKIFTKMQKPQSKEDFGLKFIRHCKQSDGHSSHYFKPLSQLFSKAFPEVGTSLQDREAELAIMSSYNTDTTYFASLPNPHNAYLPTTIGTALERNTGKDTAFIGNVATEQEYRNQGIAKALLNKIIQTNSGKTFKMDKPTNSIATRMYKKMGFDFNDDENEMVKKPKL
jgi:GNAT superfamily N-acetyltransferase